MKNWFYDRFIEKDHMLETFYRTAQWPKDPYYYRESVQNEVNHDGRRVGHNIVRSIVLHLAFFTSTYLHVQMFYGLFYICNRATQMAFP